jgi:hypothetical protein
MKQKIVVVTCAPLLNDIQSAGLMQLFKDLEQKGCRVYYYGNTFNDDFQQYTVTKLLFNKVLYKIPFYYVLQHIDRYKWITRVTHQYPPTDREFVNYKHLRSIVRVAVQYFCTVKPDLFLCWNPHSPSFGIMADTARFLGINVGAIEGGLLPGTFILDDKGTLATSWVFNRTVTYLTPEKFKTTGERIFNELRQKSISLYEQPILALPEPLSNLDDQCIKVLVIGIDMVDSGSLPETDADRLGLLPFHQSCNAQAMAIAATDKNFMVILKPHPSHNYGPQVAELSSNCWIVNSNPDELIKWADVVVCSGSKMELSAFLAGKPLVNIGAGLLYKKKCSYDVDGPSQLREQICLARQQGITAEQLQAFKQFLGFLHDDYLYVYDPAHDNTLVIDRIFQPTSITQKIKRKLLI